ncbi:MAG: FAD-dependent thymidylate synthase [Bacteroidetes bacterium]|nr:FAD-dependent thymidylate synthase [Bacteroidota bacterium]
MENSVELIGHYGGDIVHAMSAWTSTTRDLTPEKLARVPALLKMLREGSDGQPHGTPFEKSALHFLVTSEIASHIHLLKHRIGVSINGESARYKELKDDRYYLPTDWPVDEQDALEQHMLNSFEQYHATLDRLVNVHGYSRKRAKESARFYLPYATQLVCDVQFNFRSFVHFCGLRHKEGAQLEIFEIADTMINLVSNIPGDPFHHSLRAWGLVK